MTLQKHIKSPQDFGYEPSLNELLAEPMVQALMARDGVEQRVVSKQLDALARAVAAARLLKAQAH